MLFLHKRQNERSAWFILSVGRKQVFGSSAPSGTSLRTRVLNWSQYITYLTPCLKPDKTGFMFDYTCENKHPRKMSPATKSEGKRMFSQARLCSIGKIWGWVRLSSITEPNRSQSNDWSSIGFDYRAFTRCTLYILYYFRATCGKPQGDAVEWD